MFYSLHNVVLYGNIFSPVWDDVVVSHDQWCHGPFILFVGESQSAEQIKIESLVGYITHELSESKGRLWPKQNNVSKISPPIQCAYAHETASTCFQMKCLAIFQLNFACEQAGPRATEVFYVLWTKNIRKYSQITDINF